MDTEELIDEVIKQRATVAKLKTQKAALLAACRLALERVKFDKKGKSVCIPTNALTPYSVKVIQSAIKAGEGV